MAAITTAAIGVGMAGFQAYQGLENKKAGERALQNYERQDLDNAFEDIPISTIGSDLIREESQRTTADLVQASQNAGTRGISILPKIVAYNNEMNQQGRAYLDDQVNRRNYAIAGDKATIRGMNENREESDLAGIGNQIQVGRQDMWSGIRGLGNSALYAAGNIDFTGVPQQRNSAKVNTLTPAGVKYSSSFPPTSNDLLTTPFYNGF